MTKKSKNYSLVTDLKQLQQKSVALIKQDATDLVYKEQLNTTINELSSALVDNPAHYCIAANQIGKLIQVGIVNVTSPIILVNPKLVIADDSKLIPYLECNISLQNRLFITERHTHIIVSADNIVEPLDLCYNGILNQNENPELYTNTELMEIVFLQQLYDSMHGILPIQRQFVPKQTPIVHDGDKIQRNQLVTLQKGNKKVNIKFKKIDKYIDDGWAVIPFEELNSKDI